MPDDMSGKWQDYYKKWQMMTCEHLDPVLLDLVPSLEELMPPARDVLTKEGIQTVVLTGGETDVCVLAAALGAIDLGYRVVVLRDAICSSADDTHDASLELLGDRFSV
jgi:nicotinamidase-related amidase